MLKGASSLIKNVFLQSGVLTEHNIQQVINKIMHKNIDDADLYFQNIYEESWYLEDSQVKSGNFTIDKGVGIRVVSGDKTGYAYTNNIELSSLNQAAQAASSIVNMHSTFQKIHKLSLNHQSFNAKHIDYTTSARYLEQDPIMNLDKLTKITILENIDKEARSLDPRVIQVTASLSGSYELVLLVTMDGQFIPDIRPLVHINVNIIVENSCGRREAARCGGGGRHTYAEFLLDKKYLQYSRNAVREALINLEAEDAPAGSMPVILGSGWPGVLLHEAVGHGLEGDFNRKKLSAFSGLIGQQVASKGVTVVDNGTLMHKRGSLTIDDEGTLTQNTVLIENGILINYMQDKLNARLMGMESTGNCRRESYAYPPMPRMTNTYMLSGAYHPDELIASIANGLYVVNLSGGQVDITSGQFVFSTSEAYLIEQGKITKPVKGATLIGNGPEVMKKISMVANNLTLDDGIGTCGKDGQSIPVGVGQPSIKIDELTIGGTVAT